MSHSEETYCPYCGGETILDLSKKPPFFYHCDKCRVLVTKFVRNSKEIKNLDKDLWILFETNGYGLSLKNLESFKGSGIDSFWLDIKILAKTAVKVIQREGISQPGQATACEFIGTDAYKRDI